MTVSLVKEEPPPTGIKGLVARITALRWVRHLMDAGSFYVERQADLLAAGITYFGFLAFFPLLLLGISVAGFFLSGRPDLLDELIDQVQTAIPGSFGEQLVGTIQTAIDNAGTVGVVGLVGLLYAGIGWMSKMRIAMQTIWRGEPAEANFIRDNLRDLFALVGLGGALLASVALTGVVNGLTSILLELVGLDGVPGIGVLTRVLGIAVSIAGTTLIFLWLFLRLPQLDLPVRAVLPGAVFGSVGFEVLKVVGTFYLSSVASSPTAVAFGSAIGLLVWIYFSSRFLLFAAAWTATLPRVSELIVEQAGPSGPVEPVVHGPAVPPLKPPPSGVPSNGVVAAGLIGAGAVAGLAARGAARRWWRTGRERSAVGPG